MNRLWIASFVVGFLVVVGGCDMDSAARVELYHQQVVRLESLLAENQGKLETLDASLDTLVGTVNDPNLPEQERKVAWQVMQKAKSAVSAALVAKARIEMDLDNTRRAIEAVQAKGDVGIGDEFGLGGQVVTQIGNQVGGKVGAYAIIAGTVLSVLGNVLQKKKTTALVKENETLEDDMNGAALLNGETQTQLDNVTQAASAIIQGVQRAPAEAQAATKASIKEVMKTQGILNTANAVVDKLKAA